MAGGGQDHQLYTIKNSVWIEGRSGTITDYIQMYELVLGLGCFQEAWTLGMNFFLDDLCAS